MELIRAINKSLLISISFVLFSCTGLKRLQPGEKLYTGVKIKLINTGNKKIKESEIKAVAKSAVKPAPNKRILGMRPKLWAYYKAGKEPKKGIKKWLKKNSEAPVLISDVRPSEIAKFIDAKLFNYGIFNVKTEYKTEATSSKTAKVVYTSYVQDPFLIEKINYAVNNIKIENLLNAVKSKTLLKKGDHYNLETLKSERLRIDDALKNQGFFFFNPDYLLFKADTNDRAKTINLKLTLKEDIPEKSLQVYRIESVAVYPEYSLSEKKDSSMVEPFMFDSVAFYGKSKVRPEIILSSLKLKKNDIYSRREHNVTLNRLMSLGTYKFVRIVFTEIDSATKDKLAMRIFLTSLPKRTLKAEINIISKSNDFLGPQLNLTHLDRNALNGAELLNFSIGGSFETQISGKYKNLFSYSFSSKAEIFIPRFVLPFKISNTSTFYVPKTKFSFSYNYLKRVAYFDLRSAQFVYGFKWQESALKTHELNPINLNLTSVGNKTPDFLALLESNPFIKKSYEEQFIAGAVYSFLYNEQVMEGKKEQFYLNITSETSGNAFSLLNTMAGARISADDPARIGGSVYSQFFKISADSRLYFGFKKNRLVGRIFGGVGKPYGNSNTLPYIKQFFSGGPNSIRAFPINSIGPGTNSLQVTAASIFLQQGGDIKIETNLEYRFDIYKIIKGAVFSDAGNIWLFRNNPALVGDPFLFSKFYKELAVGAGFGVRLDFSFFVLRLDIATPLRKPWLPESQRWVFNRIKPSDGSWRTENLVFNIAIGYPF